MIKIPFLLFAISLFSVSVYSQNRFVVGGSLGLSVAGGVETSPGFQIGTMGEYYFNPENNKMAVGTGININTQSGTPVEWANYFKYFIEINRPDIKPYIDAGLSLWFYPGGPSAAIRFGGGINFLVAPHIYIPADVQLGPVFATGTSVFYFAVTTGIRYELP
ncbi:MAG: hypothetical protein WCE54_16320 [Ignavibacteriaceae bacterium]